LFLLKSKGPSWPTIIKYVADPSLLFVTWCLASKHWRKRGKLVNEREKMVSKPYTVIGVWLNGLINFIAFVYRY